MRKRYLYTLLYAVPGFLVAQLLAFAVTGTVAGFLWLYVFGDEPWGTSAELLLPILFVLTLLLLWITSMVLGYSTGRRLESVQALNRNHILLSSGITLALILVIVLHQWSVGNTGQQSDGAHCSDFCRQHGFAGSGMPPEDSGERSCSCYDNTGNEAVTVPVDSIPSGE